MTGAGAAFLAIPEALVLALIAAGVGRRICARLLPNSSALESSVFGFPFGMALLSLLMTGLLFARLPAVALPFTLGAVLIAAAAWGRKESVAVVRDLRGFIRESPLLAGLLAASALLGAIGALAPETGWDTGVYHFAMARIRAEEGGMVVRPDVPHGFRPAALESLHAVGFVLNGEALASMINESFYFGGLALARLWGLRLAGARGGVCATLAWLSSITYVLRMDGGDVEVGQAVYLGVAMLSLLLLRDGGAPGGRVLAGVAVGMLVGMKYASLYAVVLLAAAWVAVRLVDRAPWRDLLVDGAVIGGLGLLIACPWYLRNRLLTGSFFFPYGAAASVLPAGDLPHSEGAGRAALRALAMDGFVLIGLLSVALPGLARDRWVAAVPVLLLGWMLGTSGWTEASVLNAFRYASPAWLPLLVFGAAGVAWALERKGALRLLALGALIPAAGLGQGVLARRNLPKVSAAVGLVSRDAYLETRVSTLRAIREAEAGLAEGKRVLLVEERVYYCRAPFLAASDIEDHIDFRRISSAAEFRRFLEAQSIGAIVVDRGPNAKTWRFRDLERRLGSDWPVSGVRAVTVPGEASLYRVD